MKSANILHKLKKRYKFTSYDDLAYRVSNMIGEDSNMCKKYYRLILSEFTAFSSTVS